MKQVIKFKEQGFCYGVSRSISIVDATISDPTIPRPIYLLGDLVHNHYVNDYFSKKGVLVLGGKTRLEMLDRIDTGTVVFTAHGVSEKVRKKALDKGLTIVDATCPYVEKTVAKIREQAYLGKTLIYVGKKNHPEVETIISDFDKVIIIDETAKKCPKIKDKKVILAHQTTLSDYDVSEITKVILKTNPQVEVLKQVCIFPEKRQQEINNFDFPKAGNLIIIVGDQNSNNVSKLKELALRKNVGDVVMIDSLEELDQKCQIKRYDNIYIGSGTSTPIIKVDEIYNEVKKRICQD